MILLVILLLILIGLVLYKLRSLNDKIDCITYELFGLKSMVEDVARQRDKKTEEVSMGRISSPLVISPENIVRNDIPEASEDNASASVHPISEKSMPTPPVYNEEDMREKEIPSKRSLNIEKLVGENLFSKIGILALIIGVGFFVKFAIDNDWINQTYRTILGLTIGFGLWGIAYKLRESYRGFSSVLAGGGFAVCFVSIAIAYNYYELMPSWLAFLSLVVLTAAMILISVKFDRSELAMVAIVGGYVAPFMSASDSSSVISLLVYTTLLNTAMFVVCVKKNWWILSVTGCLITWLITAISTINASQSVVGLVFSTLFFVMFSLPLALVMWRNMRHVLFYSLFVVSIINMFAYCSLALGYIDDIEGLNNVRCIVPLLIAGLNILIYFKYYRVQNIYLMQNLLLGSVIFFAVMSVVVQFSNPNIVTVFFAVIVMFLLEIYGRFLKKIFVVSGGVLSIITFVILVIELRSNIDNPAVGSFSTMLMCGLCYFAYAIIISRKREVYANLLSTLYGPTIFVLCLVATYIEGNAVYSLMIILHTQDAALQASAVMIMACMLFMSKYFKGNNLNRLILPGATLFIYVVLNLEVNIHSLMSEIFQWLSACLFICVIAVQVRSTLIGNYSEDVSKRNKYMAYYSIVCSLFLIAVTEFILRSASLTEYYSAGFSIALIINGAVLLAIGMKYKYIAVRFIGLGMYGLLLLKLVIYDLWSLPMIGRIVVFILLGAVLLTLSFMYQRLRLKLLDKGNSESPDDVE